ncbi:hypothetical protein AWB78_02397 [Caballeronia calidae]|uniref:Uncharacterized protein n=1 Tax=Caballeronia calidae TaxID=1777139 RepID=A0A158B868_9BURK|nr:BPSL0761 family protein [Caballeronia calidae]SAK66295.1 hypothetical protein AWB78_02397 [Caballeronia calidae]
MTTPRERTIALLRARELLQHMSVLQDTVNTAALRSKAAGVLRHYPDDGMIKAIAGESKWLETRDDAAGLSPLTKKVSLPAIPSSIDDPHPSFLDDFRQREIESLRARIRAGKLVTDAEFQRRLGLSEARLRRLVVNGSVFAIDVDGLRYFPALLAEGHYNRKRLFSVCRLLVPAPTVVRLHYLTSRRGNLGGLTPLECLNDDERYKLLRRMSWAEAIEWHRTTITAYAGQHNFEPANVAPAYRGAEELDPRENVWQRSLATLRHHGFTGVAAPYERLNEATIFVAQSKAGLGEPIDGARLYFTLDGGYATVTVERFQSEANDNIKVKVDGNETVEEAMRAIFSDLLNRGLR